MSGQSPLSPSCIKGLTDKIYDKRKSSALEIEKLVQTAVTAKDDTQIRQVVKLLRDFTNSPNTPVKKGGMIGLAAVAAGLGPQNIDRFICDIAKPIISCLSDNNGQNRYYATESLYNVLRVARNEIIPVFNDLFTAVTNLITDPDSNVCSGAGMLDSTMKGIIKECGEKLDLATFIPIVRSKLYTNNQRLQTLLVSWIDVLHGIPSIDLAPVLTEIMDGLLLILQSPFLEVVTTTESLLSSLLVHCRDNSEGVDSLSLTPLFVQHARSPSPTLKIMSLTWLNDLLTLGGRDLLPHAAPILAAALPSVKSHKVAEEVTFKIMKLLDPSVDDTENHSQQEMATIISKIVYELLEHLRADSEQCKFIALRWLLYLLQKFPNKMNSELINLCEVLLPVLSDPSDAVVVLVLQLYASIARTPLIVKDKPNSFPYFKEVFAILLDKLKKDKALLQGRGPLIFRELCVLLTPTEVYVMSSELLQEQTQYPDFVSNMSSILATILITSRELFALRLELRKLETKESCDLFFSLFKCWSHNPISVLLLCLLSQNYQQSALLVRQLAEVEVTVEFLVEVDKLIQLLECPIFTFLRLDLLNNDKNSIALIDTLYGLLMVLPQSKSYTTLATRLNNLPPPHRALHNVPDNSNDDPNAPRHAIDYSSLLEHFKSVQKTKRDHNRQVILKKIEEDSSIETLMTNATMDERQTATKSKKERPKYMDWNNVAKEPY